jgi:hypothetical protein
MINAKDGGFFHERGLLTIKTICIALRCGRGKMRGLDIVPEMLPFHSIGSLMHPLRIQPLFFSNGR